MSNHYLFKIFNFWLSCHLIFNTLSISSTPSKHFSSYQTPITTHLQTSPQNPQNPTLITTTHHSSSTKASAKLIPSYQKSIPIQTITKSKPQKNNTLTQNSTPATIKPQIKPTGSTLVMSPISTQLTSAPPASCPGYYAYLKFRQRTVCLQSTANTNIKLSYRHGYIYNSDQYRSYNRYIFAHNSPQLFDFLQHLPIGSTFQLTISGSTKHYKISKNQVLCDPTNPSHPCSNYPEKPLDMFPIIHPHLHSADLSLMTCAGTPLKHGDATHRRVVYAVLVQS